LIGGYGALVDFRENPIELVRESMMLLQDIVPVMDCRGFDFLLTLMNDNSGMTIDLFDIKSLKTISNMSASRRTVHQWLNPV
jgi:hypothetical protein